MDVIIFIPGELANSVRRRIQDATGIPAGNITVTATHTHSGPITVNYLSNEADRTVPTADTKYLKLMEDAIFTAAVEAHKSLQPAKLGLAVADATGIGTNRHDPNGPSDMKVPVLLVKKRTANAILQPCWCAACIRQCCMKIRS
ncbi:MAG TPA: hypothetical protein PKK48_07935 [Phycisphaerae bacterium]|nr:hypothetical protein [Phycisphaerae bacterium]